MNGFVVSSSSKFNFNIYFSFTFCFHQKPLILKGHGRPITFLKYNHEGDLLFSCAKDSIPTVWFSDNGGKNTIKIDDTEYIKRSIPLLYFILFIYI